MPSEAAKAHSGGDLILTDFTPAHSDLAWYVVNDEVMGGQSKGNFEQDPGTIRFFGSTNTNGGGFSSIRSQPLQLDLSTYAGIRLRIKADRRRYTWRLTTDARFQGRQVGYWADFETRDSEWHNIDIPFASFDPRVRGEQLDGPALNLGQVTGTGLMIYDKEDGPFELRLSSVVAYSPGEP